MSDHAINVVALALERWRTLLIGTLLGASAAVVYILVAPAWYESTLTVVPSQRSTDTLALSLSAKLPDSFDTSNTDVQRIKAVLMSTSVTDAVIKKFSLIERYEVRHIEDARRAVREHCPTSVDKKSGVVTLSCEDKDPKVATEIAAFFGEEGNRVFGRVYASSAREERQFLESQVTKARADVAAASKRLKEFQEAHKLIDLPEQSKATISAMASLQGDLLSKELELSYLSRFSSKTEASVQQLQQQIAILKGKLAQLENSPAAASATQGEGSAFFPNAMTVPSLRFELEELLREQKIQETVFLLMTQRYEMARIDEARDTSTFQILDQPTVPTLKSRPKRKRVLMLGLVGGCALACAWIAFPLWLKRRLVVAASA